MIKKQLNEKIKDIFFGAIIFFMMYLIIGFLLKSEWLVSSKEIWKNSYELFRDGLTLTAYFLTPVVAIVLFNDWREQHIEIKNEKISEDIIEQMRKFISWLNHTPPALSESKYNYIRGEYYENLGVLRLLVSKINTKSNEAKDFKKEVDQALIILSEYGVIWIKSVSSAAFREAEVKYVPLETNELYKKYNYECIQAIQDMSTKTAEYMKIMNSLKPLKV